MHAAKVVDHLFALVKAPIGEVLRAAHIRRLGARVAHIGDRQAQALGRVFERARVHVQAPRYRIGVVVEAFSGRIRSRAHPLGGEQVRAAKVFAKMACLLAAQLAINAAQELDVLFGGLHRQLIELVLVGQVGGQTLFERLLFQLGAALDHALQVAAELFTILVGRFDAHAHAAFEHDLHFLT